jgi:hypothetical protein
MKVMNEKGGKTQRKTFALEITERCSELERRTAESFVVMKSFSALTG